VSRHSSVAIRVVAALIGIIGLEMIRYFTFSSEYLVDPSLWLVIAGSIAFNLWFQWWTLPDTALKALIAAALTQTGLPPAARIVANAVVAQAGTNLVLLAPDVARVFKDSNSVNRALRRLLPGKASKADGPRGKTGNGRRRAAS